jgi:hypothetical protein
MSKTVLIAALALAASAAATLPAAAFGGCNPCYPQPQYRQVVTPPQYRVIHRTVMVAPPRVVMHRIPAQYGVVQQTVMVSPARVSVQAVCDACGNVGYRHHMVPAQYGTVARTVMVAPPRYVAETIPGRYATVAHTEMIAPAQARWVPAGCNSCGY